MGPEVLIGMDFSLSFSWIPRSSLKPFLLKWVSQTLLGGPARELHCCNFEPNFPWRGLLAIRPALVSSGLQETGLFHSGSVNLPLYTVTLWYTYFWLKKPLEMWGFLAFFYYPFLSLCLEGDFSFL